MLEIIVLIFLTKNIGNLAIKKGLKAGTWKLYTVLAWFGGEILGIVIGLSLWGQEELIAAVLVGLAFAVASYLVLRSNLNNKPDAEDDISNIGNDIPR